jgi:hypothetical protein
VGQQWGLAMVDGVMRVPVLAEAAARVWERVADVMVAVAAELLFALDHTRTTNARSPSGQQR